MKHRFTAIAIVITGAILGASCGLRHEPSGKLEALGRSLQTAVDDAVAYNEAVHGAALAVDAPRLGLTWRGAAGIADPSGERMTPGHPVRIASNTKTYIAASILRLWEEGRLGLDDPISAHLPEAYVETLRGDGYDPDAITVRHLLTHTSGLYEHSSSEEYLAAITADPMHGWTRTEQIEAAMAWGDPLGPPGRYFSYCDTGYILLGEIIERVSGQPMAAAVRSLVGFEHLGLDATWWETLEPELQGVPKRAHQFLGDIDTADFNPSYDLWGGGGIVCTVGDLARFIRALFTDGVFHLQETDDMMLTTVDGASALPGATAGGLQPGDYRMGVWIVEVAGFTGYRHTGFFGTSATYVPELDLSVAATVNQNQGRAALGKLTEDAIAVTATAIASRQ